MTYKHCLLTLYLLRSPSWSMHVDGRYGSKSGGFWFGKSSQLTPGRRKTKLIMRINSLINSRNPETRFKLSESYSVWTQPLFQGASFSLNCGKGGKKGTGCFVVTCSAYSLTFVWMSRSFFIQSKVKLKPIGTQSHRFSRALRNYI